MNSLSVRKLRDLFSQRSHRITEIFIQDTQIFYVLLFCEKYRNFFMVDLRSLPLHYDETTREYHVTNIHETELPDINWDALSSLYSFKESQVTPPSYVSAQLQKERLQRVHFHISSYMRLAYFVSTYLLQPEVIFQIQNVRYSEHFAIYSVSIDDYYVHHSTISQDLSRKYSELFDFVYGNIMRQSSSLNNLFKNVKSIQSSINTMKTHLEMFQKYTHMSASIYQRVHLKKHLHSMLIHVIDILFLIFRAQTEFVLKTEDKYYSLTFHTNSILECLQDQSAMNPI